MRLDRQKDICTLIRAVWHLNKFTTINKKAHLAIVGTGELKEFLIKFTKHYKITKYIHFFDWTYEVSDFYFNSDIFLFSSCFEGFGRVILEAMHASLPVIVSNTEYGPRELIDNGKYGIMIKKFDYLSFSRNISLLLKDLKLLNYYRNQSRKRISYFSQWKFQKRYIKVLDDLTSQID